MWCPLLQIAIFIDMLSSGLLMFRLKRSCFCAAVSYETVWRANFQHVSFGIAVLVRSGSTDVKIWVALMWQNLVSHVMDPYFSDIDANMLSWKRHACEMKHFVIKVQMLFHSRNKKLLKKQRHLSLLNPSCFVSWRASFDTFFCIAAPPSSCQGSHLRDALKRKSMSDHWLKEGWFSRPHPNSINYIEVLLWQLLKVKLTETDQDFGVSYFQTFFPCC